MSDFDEQLLSSQIVFSGRLLTVRIDSVRLPDGREATREVVQHPGAVAMVPRLGDDLILVRQWRQPLGRAMLEIPAGTLKPGEPHEACADRELREEIGYAPGRLTKLAAVALAPGYSSEVLQIYLAEDLIADRAAQDADEFVRAERVPMREAVRRAVAGDFDDAKTVAGVLLTWARDAGAAPGD
jgi:ADP-ribose pyrophosphatase